MEKILTLEVLAKHEFVPQHFIDLDLNNIESSADPLNMKG